MKIIRNIVLAGVLVALSPLDANAFAEEFNPREEEARSRGRSANRPKLTPAEKMALKARKNAQQQKQKAQQPKNQFRPINKTRKGSRY